MESEAHFLGLARPLGDPGLGLIPGLVEGEEARLATALDELIGLCDELGREDPAGELRVGGDGASLGIPGDLGDPRGGVLEVGLGHGVRGDGGRSLEPVGQQELGIVFADRCKHELIVEIVHHSEEDVPLDDMMRRRGGGGREKMGDGR